MATYKELLAQREELEKLIEQARQVERADVLKTVRALVADFGLNAMECGFSQASTKGGKASSAVVKRVVPVKYAGPKGEFWTGRGRAPKWLETLEAAGRSRSEFLLG